MKKIVPIFALIIGLLIGVLLLIVPVGIYFEEENMDLWYAQAPFGVIYASTSGHFTWGTGSINTSPSEAYSIKYFEDGQLQSLVLDATETPIVVDGTFKVTKSTEWHKNIYGMSFSSHNFEVRYVLHLPSLPANVSVGMLAP